MNRPYDRENEAFEFPLILLGSDVENVWSAENTAPQNDVGVRAYVRNLCETHVLVQDTRKAGA